MVNPLFNKVLCETEKHIFYFYFKSKGAFWPTQQEVKWRESYDPPIYSHLVRSTDNPGLWLGSEMVVQFSIL